jgi:hypothetical protein
VRPCAAGPAGAAGVTYHVAYVYNWLVLLIVLPGYPPGPAGVTLEEITNRRRSEHRSAVAGA